MFGEIRIERKLSGARPQVVWRTQKEGPPWLRYFAYPFENSLRDEGLAVRGDDVAGVVTSLDPQRPRFEHHERLGVQRRHVEVIGVLGAYLCHCICLSVGFGCT